ncbi:MAG TPA: hypothetical protein VN777_12135 [Terriglobales bacterium]|nr:hypothetical protein [Terriglobales bacterium]HZW96288.1 hypothetical protein [Candidatus Eremiobacteraceae bacterium]
MSIKFEHGSTICPIGRTASVVTVFWHLSPLKNAGFVLGGGARDGLLLDCFNPIVHGTARPKAASRPLPNISPELVNACRAGNDSAYVAAPKSAPLVPAADGQTVYDLNLNVTWLADGNLAGKETFGVSNINKDGSMD